MRMSFVSQNEVCQGKFSSTVVYNNRERLQVRNLTESFFRVFSKKNRHPGKLYCTFHSPEKLALLSLMQEVKPSTDHKMIKLLPIDNLFPPLRHSR